MVWWWEQLHYHRSQPVRGGKFLEVNVCNERCEHTDSTLLLCFVNSKPSQIILTKQSFFLASSESWIDGASVDYQQAVIRTMSSLHRLLQDWASREQLGLLLLLVCLVLVEEETFHLSKCKYHKWWCKRTNHLRLTRCQTRQMPLQLFSQIFSVKISSPLPSWVSSHSMYIASFNKAM